MKLLASVHATVLVTALTLFLESGCTPMNFVEEGEGMGVARSAAMSPNAVQFAKTMSTFEDAVQRLSARISALERWHATSVSTPPSSAEWKSELAQLKSQLENGRKTLREKLAQLKRQLDRSNSASSGDVEWRTGVVSDISYINRRLEAIESAFGN